MIVTVTANTTLDQTLLIPTFAPNRTLRATRSVYSMGGKPTDASFILGELGLPSLALGFAAGPIGTKVEIMLSRRSVITDFVRVNGETRINTIIVTEDSGDQTTITTSTLEVAEAHIAQLRVRYIAALDNATCMITGGTLPKGVEPGFYTDFIRLARQRNIPVIFDAGEPNLSAGLAAGPTFIKPNHDELAELIGQPVDSLETAYRAGRDILERYGTASIITLGREGALAVLPDSAYRIPPLNVKVVSSSGAGNAVLAGLAAALHRGEPIEAGLRLGFAAANAVLLTLGTAECKRADIERFLPQIELIPYNL